ncbi:MAG: STAS/SEC14 domain-containing protein [Porphyrobacter sp.]|nr:STAS/SEC14 domain-containing protein [Porphyrobacter sp.]
MIGIEFPFDDLVELTPQGALTEADFDRVAQALDEHVNAHDVVPRILVHPRGIPHWASLAAMCRHFHLVKERHQVVKKVALVGDVGLLAVLPQLVDHFVDAKVRHFPEEKIAAAREWLRQDEDHPGRFEVIDGLPDDVVALRVSGIITSQDYRDMLVPLVNEKLKRHDKLKCLIVIDDDFIAYSPEAAWDDARFGFSHWADFGPIAVVTDVGWIRTATRLFAPLMRSEVRIFATDELEEAKSWIKR